MWFLQQHKPIMEENAGKETKTDQESEIYASIFAPQQLGNVVRVVFAGAREAISKVEGFLSRANANKRPDLFKRSHLH